MNIRIGYSDSASTIGTEPELVYSGKPMTHLITIYSMQDLNKHKQLTSSTEIQSYSTGARYFHSSL